MPRTICRYLESVALISFCAFAPTEDVAGVQICLLRCVRLSVIACSGVAASCRLERTDNGGRKLFTCHLRNGTLCAALLSFLVAFLSDAIVLLI
jgi:hypothetical protein